MSDHQQGDLTRNVPEILYKYRSWSDKNHKRLLTHGELFFASPRSFNDPFDRGIHPNLLAGTDEQWDKYYEKSLGAEVDPVKKGQKKRTLDILSQARKNPRDVENTLSWDIDEWMREQSYLDNTGILTLSATSEDVVLWSHYADSHKGFCVGFDFSEVTRLCESYALGKNMKCYQFDVAYTTEFPIYPFIDLFDDSGSTSKKMFATKHKNWEYEQEWRIVFTYGTNIRIHIPRSVIRSVIFGWEMPLEDQEEITSILRYLDSDIDLFKAVKKTADFGLDLYPLPYK